MRTMLLIIGLALIVILLLGIAFSTQQKQTITTTQPPPRVTQGALQPQAETRLSLSPQTLLAPKGQTQTLLLTIDSKSNAISGVEVELAYEPSVVTIIAIKPGTFFTSPIVLPVGKETKKGTIRYSLALGPGLSGKQGSGTVAEIEYRINQTVKSGTQTQIQILPSSIVTDANSTTSVLSEANGTTITIE